MNLNVNKENIKKSLKAGFLIGILLTGFTGCKNNTPEEKEQNTSITTESFLDDNDINDPDYFTNFEDFNISHWYVIKYTDETIQMTRMTTLDNININKKIYYYTDAFTGGKVLGKVLYIRDENKYWIMEGKEIESAISITDYINNHQKLYQKNYTKEDMEYIFESIKKDYEKKIDIKDKVLMKENSLY